MPGALTTSKFIINKKHSLRFKLTETIILTCYGCHYLMSLSSVKNTIDISIEDEKLKFFYSNISVHFHRVITTGVYTTINFTSLFNC